MCFPLVLDYPIRDLEASGRGELPGAAPSNWGIRWLNELLALIHGKKDSRAAGR